MLLFCLRIIFCLIFNVPLIVLWYAQAPSGYKKIYMLNSTDHETSTAHKN